MRVLLIEDDPDIQKIAAMALRFDGRFEVMQANSGKQGLELAKREQPDLVLLDVMMPEMDGYETLRHLKEDERTSAIPVVFLSARALEQEVQRGKSMGAIAYLTKPFDPLKLPGVLYAMVNPA